MRLETSYATGADPDLGHLYRLEEEARSMYVDEWGDARQGTLRVTVHVYKLSVTRWTRCGAWIQDRRGDRRFVNLTARKRYACRTLEEAIESFVARKDRQASIYRHRARVAENAVAIARRGVFDREVPVYEAAGFIRGGPVGLT